MAGAITIRSIVFAAAFYVATALFLLLGSWLLLAPRSWAMQGLRLHGLACLWLLKVVCGTRIEVRGREKLPEGACLVVAKHQSAWDTFALVPIFDDPAIVLKDELKWIPFYGWFCVKFEHILVKRDRAAVALKAMLADARKKAGQHRQIVIFPEGTRRAPGAPPDYKPGYVALYEGLGIPLVPLALNSGLFWPRRSWRRYPGTIVVEILDPVPPGLKRAEVRRAVEARIEEASNRLLAEAMASTNPPPTPNPDPDQPENVVAP
ncbi:MAG: lysophospholipid acyltransferase family protein [Hyphomicrobiaceae bacterium]